jgi:hypothetical protein
MLALSHSPTHAHTLSFVLSPFLSFSLALGPDISAFVDIMTAAGSLQQALADPSDTDKGAHFIEELYLH